MTFTALPVQFLANRHNLEDRIRERTVEQEAALAKVRTLSGFLPICASCEKIRDDQGYRIHSQELSNSIECGMVDCPGRFPLHAARLAPFSEP